MKHFMWGYMVGGLLAIIISTSLLMINASDDAQKMVQSCEVACAPYQAEIKEDSCHCADKRVMSHGWHVAK